MKTICIIIITLFFAVMNAAAADKMMRCSAPEQEGDVNKLPASHNDSIFERTLELLGINFHLTSPNNGSINKLQIELTGLALENPTLVKMIDGTVTGAEAADLNMDGSPEIYVYVTSGGSGSYGSLVAYSVNRLKSVSEIYLPPIAEDKAVSSGYMGHDEFGVAGNSLARKFPVYCESDTNIKPTGGMRQLLYKLVAGEDGWLLKLDKVLDE